MVLAAGVDLGGTNITVALVDDEQRIIERARVPTPQTGPRDVTQAIVAAVGQLDPPPALVGVGAPGPVSQGVVATAPNLAGWTEPVPLARHLQHHLKVPVVVDNDATVGTVGEWQAGAGRGADNVLGVWLGTGVGGGLVLAGRTFRGARGLAGEFGHTVVRQGGALCGCGRRGCVEAYAGRASMERAVHVSADAGRRSRLLDLASDRGKDRLTAGVWSKALKERDPIAVAVYDEALVALGAAVASAANLLDLERVVVGGGLTEKLGEGLVGRLAETMGPHVLVPEHAPELVVAQLGDDSGVVGAAALARELLDATRRPGGHAVNP